MDLQAIFIYCLSEEIILSLNFKDDPQCKMSTAEILTFVIISVLYYPELCPISRQRLFLGPRYKPSDELNL